MFAGMGANLGMQGLTAGAPVAEFAADWATRDLGLALAAGFVAAMGILIATRLLRRARRLTALSLLAAGLPAVPAHD